MLAQSYEMNGMDKIVTEDRSPQWMSFKYWLIKQEDCLKVDINSQALMLPHNLQALQNCHEC